LASIIWLHIVFFNVFCFHVMALTNMPQYVCSLGINLSLRLVKGCTTFILIIYPIISASKDEI
jgi:hypothetical protein